MGVVRLLCITILFAACLVAALDCNGNGHLNSNGDCVCNSGFSDATCGTQFSSCSTFLPAVNNKADRHPILDETIDKITFTGNTLKLAIVSHLVPNRTYTDIVFVQNGAAAPASYCSLNTASGSPSLWAQKAQTSGSACNDEFQLTMPWAHWSDCGFAETGNTASSFWTYKARFVISYTDDVGAPFDYSDITVRPEMYRKSTVSYTVYVHFLRQTEIINYLNINVNNTVDYEVAITRFDYDPSVMQLTFGISTMVLWPNRMDRTTMTLATATAMSGYTITNSGTPTSDAANAAGEAQYCMVNSGNCLQYFEYTIQLNAGNCDFNGVYVIQGTVDTCRDRTADCTQGTQSATIDVVTSDVCGTVTAEPTVDGALFSYDSNHNVQTDFIVGSRGYFEVEMTSQQNDFNLTWINIWVVADQDVPSAADLNSVTLPNIQYLLKDYTLQTAGFHNLAADQPAGTMYGDFNSGANPEATGPCDLQINQDATKLSKNGNTGENVFTPHFNFRFDSRIFPIPLAAGGAGQVTKGYTLHAIGHIVYAGNERYGRTEETVEFVWSTDAAQFDGKVKFALAAPSSAAETKSNTNTALIASLAPVAGIALVVVAAAVVAAVVINRRKASSTFATLN